MFESAELGHKIDQKTFNKEAPGLRRSLIDTQFELLEHKSFPLIILVGGVDGAGKGETVNLLNEWMDPRHIQTHAMGEPSDEERERPDMWRFWRCLPPRGKVGIFFGSWYTAPIVDRVLGRIDNADLEERTEEILRFERMLTDEGALIIKLWFHLSKSAQKKRLTALEKNSLTRWRVTGLDWERFKIYDKFRKVSERTLRRTSTANAPWLIIEGLDSNYRSLAVGRMLRDAIRTRLDSAKSVARDQVATQIELPTLDQRQLLNTLDYRLKLEGKAYDGELEKWQGRLNLLSRHPKFKRISVVAVFEGNDAAGKGGAIRRITRALDARYYDVVPIAAPTEEERAQPYMWRFWRHIPRRGRVTIFDRSWYGRVLVERVERLCPESDWMRAYTEIHDFEDQLARHGIVVAKFWLAISNDEQLRRFKEREATPFKAFKITEEDWRNREKWDLYTDAVCAMVDRTSTEIAPWTLVEANDKYFARIKVLRTLCERIEAAL